MNILYKVAPEDRSRWGDGLTVYYGIHEGPIGKMLIARTGNFLCWLGMDSVAEALRKDFPAAKLVHDEGATASLAGEILRAWRLRRPPFLHIMLYGTEFQHRVWQALLDVPPGKIVSYKDIASMINQPKAARAVGRAIGANPVSILIPCHRVISTKGDLHGYRWGVETKKGLLQYEQEAA